MGAVFLKSDAEIDEMRLSCRLAAQTLDFIAPYIKPGINTLELNDLCHDFIVKNGAIPAPLNYKGFPKSICTSINNVICHGIPKTKDVLKDGDIINVDITTILHGWHGDTSRTFLVGNVKPEAKKLVKCAEDCLRKGIESVQAGGRIGDIGAAIQAHAESQGYSVVREFVGHGIGKIFHEDPQVSHFGAKGRGERIVPGMTFTIEPMINAGKWQSKVKNDGWTAVTIDNSWSAQFEHTIAIRSNGDVQILTKS
jgi:methionyl aminopeptidase